MMEKADNYSFVCEFDPCIQGYNKSSLVEMICKGDVSEIFRYDEKMRCCKPIETNGTASIQDLAWMTNGIVEMECRLMADYKDGKFIRFKAEYPRLYRRWDECLFLSEIPSLS